MNQPFPPQKSTHQGAYTQQDIYTQQREWAMQQHSSPQRLTLQDRHNPKGYASMPMPTYHQDVTTAIRPIAHPKQIYWQQQRGTRRHRKRLFTLLTLLFFLMAATIPGVYYLRYLLTTKVASDNSKHLIISTTKDQNATSSSTANLKIVAQAKIDQLAAAIHTIQLAGGDTRLYQQKLEQDRAKLATCVLPKDYIVLLIQIASDSTSLQSDLAGNNASTELSNFTQEAQQWGEAHKYHDAYDGNDYYLDSSYLNMDGHNGVMYGASAYLNGEVNTGNPQAAQDIKDDYFLLSMLEVDYEDTTPYSQPHQVDQALLNYFGLQHAHVLITSLTEQAIRIYNNGSLEQAFLVTTGRVYRPTPVGEFQLTQHFYHLTLTSYDPPGSPDYYAPVVVQNAIQFWDNGYLIHSSQWRQDYGPFTQFPHHDSGGDPQASVGSHGCINIPPNILSDLDATITDPTPLIVF